MKSISASLIVLPLICSILSVEIANAEVLCGLGKAATKLFKVGEMCPDSYYPILSTDTFQGPKGDKGDKGERGEAGPSGKLTWRSVTSDIQLEDGNGYFITSGHPVLTLPESPESGDTISIVATGGSWSLATLGSHNIAGRVWVKSSLTVAIPSGNPSHPQYYHPPCMSSDGAVMFYNGSPSWGGNGNLYRSGDGGRTWSLSRDESKGVACSTNGQIVLATRTQDGIYRSTDSGSTWERIFYASHPNVASSGDGSVLLASDDARNTHKSSDGGASWTNLGFGSFKTAAISNDGNVMITSDYNNTVRISNDQGATWISRTGLGFVVSVSGSGSLLLAATQQVISISNDGGATWTPRHTLNTPGRYFSQAKINYDGSKIAVYDGKGVWISSDLGINWSYLSNIHGPVTLSADGGTILASVGLPDGSFGQVSVRRLGSSPGAQYAAIGEEGSSIQLVYVGDDTWAVISSSGGVVFN
jgi:hypothetical protein